MDVGFVGANPFLSVRDETVGVGVGVGVGVPVAVGAELGSSPGRWIFLPATVRRMRKAGSIVREQISPEIF